MREENAAVTQASGRANDEVTPESLMASFKGAGLTRMVVVTLVFHVVVIALFSIGYLKKSLLGDDVGKLTKEQRVEKAMSDATASLMKIAEANGLNPQDISERLSPGGARSAKADAAAPAADAQGKPVVAAPAAQAPAGAPVPAPAKPESAIEKDLKKAVDGPKMPGTVGKDDIF
jgi:hypothetical protein